MRSISTAFLLLLVACSGREEREMSPGMEKASAAGKLVRVARLGLRPEEPPGLEALRAAFTVRNPGYDLVWRPGVRELQEDATTRVAFVQGGQARAVVSGGAAEDASELGVGDLVVLRPRQALAADGELDLLVFTVPEPPGAGVPAVIRPDWDPKITDTPGGCATDPGAYRRLLLTWNPKRGPYVFHAFNVHRIRADDSFTHYHPDEGGFDEFYLVQEAPPGSKFLYSYDLERIEGHEQVTPAQAQDLLRAREHLTPEQAAAQDSEGLEPGLLPGDLIYIPRGVVHRGLGGIVAQIIAVPGFVPGGEIGVDDELKAINERLGLEGPAAVPFHEDG